VIVSLLLAGVFGFAWLSMAAGPADESTLLVRDILWWVTVGNLALGIINAALAYPYDGGRVVRGLVWMATRDKLRATRIASRVGRAFSIALMFAAAIWALLTGDILDPIWLFIAGLFLLQSSRRQVRRLEIRQAVEGLTVNDVMDEKFDVVGPNLTIDTLYEQHERRGDVGTYPVTADGELVGSVDMGQIERVPRTDWGRTRVVDVMTTLERLQTITRRESVMDALLRFEGTTIDAIPVVSEANGSHMVGLLSRDRLVEKLRPRIRKVAERDRPAESGG
jgi:CBS domain-containing protein